MRRSVVLTKDQWDLVDRILLVASQNIYASTVGDMGKKTTEWVQTQINLARFQIKKLDNLKKQD